jgi:UDP-N-acetyl-D-mannosaminuronic acid transferase (WecB/TagA/CpsF family)
LCQEPRRLWKRYLVNNAAFLGHLALQVTGSKRYELTSELAEVEWR